MGPLFDNPAFFQHDDVVCFENGIEAVGDRDDGTSLHQATRGFFEQGLGFRVKAGGRLVENQDGRIHQEGAGQGKPLGLATAETCSPLADESLVFFRERFNKFMQVRGIGCLDHLLV